MVVILRAVLVMLQAYSPLGKATSAVINNNTVAKAAQKHGVTNAQVLIRWSLQKGFICLPKSSNPERQKVNLNVFSFELDQQDMKELDALEQNLVTAWDPISQHPV
jgi:diketogulonate reductase-like aldo/keto reductase